MMPERIFKINVNAHEYLVEVGDLSHSPVTVIVNGRSYQVDITTETATATVEKDSKIPTAVSTLVHTTPSTPSSGGKYTQIHAPMPGHILNIAVKPGEYVQMGQTLCALEAMKMKNAIRAPREGMMTSINVTDGQSVTHGDILFTLT